MSDDQSALIQARQDVITYARRAASDGLVIGTAGNFSVRIGEVMVITPSGVPYDAVRQDEVCVIRLADGTLQAGARPSSETPMHLATYSSYPAAAIVHTHPPFVVALSAVLDELPAVHYAMARLGGPVRVAPYTRFGSDELAMAAVEYMSGRNAVILGNHGALSFGDTLAEAYERTLVLEWLASAYWHAKLAGTPRLVSERQLEEVAAAHALGLEEEA